MEGAETPDEIGGVNARDGSVRKALRDGVEGEAVVGVIEGWDEIIDGSIFSLPWLLKHMDKEGRTFVYFSQNSAIDSLLPQLKKLGIFLVE